MSVITVDLTTFIVCRGRKCEDKHLDDDDDNDGDDDDDDNDDDDVNRRPPPLPLGMPRVNIIFVSFFFF